MAQTQTKAQNEQAPQKPVHKPAAPTPVARAKEAILLLAAGVASEGTVGPALLAFDYKASGYKSLEHAAAVFLGVFPEGKDHVVPTAMELRTLAVKIGGRAVKVQAVIQAARRAMNKAAGMGQPGQDRKLTPERIESRLNRLVSDAVGQALEVTAIARMKAAISTLEARLKAERDKGHQKADKS